MTQPTITQFRVSITSGDTETITSDQGYEFWVNGVTTEDVLSVSWCPLDDEDNPSDKNYFESEEEAVQDALEGIFSELDEGETCQVLVFMDGDLWDRFHSPTDPGWDRYLTDEDRALLAE